MKSPPLLDEEDQGFMNDVFKVISNSFGTEDADWFSAAEAYLNTILELKSKTAPALAKDFL